MAEHPPLSSSINFEYRLVQGDINITTGRSMFAIKKRPSDYLPVLSGGSINLWDPAYSEPFGWAGEELADHLFQKAKSGTKNKSSSYFQQKVDTLSDIALSQPRLVIRQIASATNSRTCIVAIVPSQRVIASGLHYLHRRQGSPSDDAFLLGILASIPFDWYLRNWVELNVTFELLYPCPIPRPSDGDVLRQRLIVLAGRRAARETELLEWSSHFGVAAGPVDDQEDFAMLCEIDALSALLYRLSSAQLTYIFESFQRNWDYKERLTQVLRYYEAWAAKV
jgi:hypothetical protein